MTTKIRGKVIHGDGYGKILGFPTANLDRRDYIRKKMKIRLGVWAGTASAGSKIYKAGIVIGPLDKQRLPKIETHFIGFKGSLYGKSITIELQKYLRPFKNYGNVNKLKKQIASDVKKIKLIIK